MPDKNKELSKILLLAASVLLSGASVVFLLICLISDSEGPWVLPAVLGCSVLSSLFSIARSAGEIKEHIEKRSPIEQAEQDLLNSIDDPDERKRISEMLN